MAQPVLQSSIRTRYTLVQMIVAATIEITSDTATGDQVVYNRDVYTTTRTDMIAFVVAQRPNEGAAMAFTPTGLNVSDNFVAPSAGDAITVPALTPMGTGILLTKSGSDPCYWKSITAVDVNNSTHGTAGEMYDIVFLPKWNDDDLVDGSDGFCDIRYARGGDVSPGATMMPIADRMDAVNVSIAVRGSNTFTLSTDYVSNSYANGIARLRGRKVCLLFEFRENGGAKVTEYLYLGNAVVNELPLSMPDNAVLTINASGYFDRSISYAP